MPWDISTPVGKESLIDEHRGILLVVQEDCRGFNECVHTTQKRIGRAIELIALNPEMYVRYKKQARCSMSEEDKDNVIRLFGFNRTTSKEFNTNCG